MTLPKYGKSMNAGEKETKIYNTKTFNEINKVEISEPC